MVTRQSWAPLIMTSNTCYAHVQLRVPLLTIELIELIHSSFCETEFRVPGLRLDHFEVENSNLCLLNLLIEMDPRIITLNQACNKRV